MTKDQIENVLLAYLVFKDFFSVSRLPIDCRPGRNSDVLHQPHLRFESSLHLKRIVIARIARDVQNFLRCSGIISWRRIVSQAQKFFSLSGEHLPYAISIGTRGKSDRDRFGTGWSCDEPVIDQNRYSL